MYCLIQQGISPLQINLSNPLTRIDIIYIAFLTSMNNIKKITSFSLVAGMFLIAALATSAANRTAFAQNMSNQTVANQTSSAMNQTSSQ